MQLPKHHTVQHLHRHMPVQHKEDWQMETADWQMDYLHRV